MSKKKNSPALFEVISKSVHPDIEMPPWMGKAPAQAPGSEAMDSAAKLSAPRSAAEAAAQVKPAELTVSKTSGRLQLSLSQTNCFVAAMVILGLLIGAFLLGRASAPTGPQATQQAGVDSPGKQDGRKTPPDAGAKRTVPLPKRIPEKYYLVIQGLQGVGEAKLAEARRIANYCTACGEPANVAKYTHPQTGRQQYIVWSRTPLGMPTGEKARAHALSIEKMGEKYFAKHRTYNFKHTRNSRGQIEPWYEKYQ